MAASNKKSKPAPKAQARSVPKSKAASAASRAAPKMAAPRRHATALLKMPRPSLAAQFSGAATEKLPPRLQALVDRSDIAQALASFARALDRMDETLLRSVLHADATLDLGPGIFQGTGGDYVHWVLGVLQGVKSTHHMLGQIRVDLSGDAAFSETYFQLHVRVEKPVGREDVFMGGRNLDRLERRPSGSAGVWKIAHRKQVLDWVRTEGVSEIFYHQNPDALWSNRSKTDPSYQMAQFPGSQQGGKLPAFLGRRYDKGSVRF